MVNNVISNREYEITHHPYSPDKERSTLFSYKLASKNFLFGFVDSYDLACGNFDPLRDQSIQWLIEMKENSLAQTLSTTFVIFLFFPFKMIA